MANEYASQAQFKNWLEIDSLDTELDELIDEALTAASRGIDNACKRHFFQVAGTRTFTSDSAYSLLLGTWNDLANITLLSTDDEDDGLFESWDPDEFVLAPLNDQAGEVLPARRVDAKGRTFPRRLGSIRIDGTWGWEEIPAAIHEATIIQAARLVKRRKSPEGVVGLNMFGTVRMGRVDPDVKKLIKRYQLRTVG